MRTRNTYILIISILLFPLFSDLNAQTLKAYLKAAEQAVENNDHYSALVYYKNVLEFEEENIEYLNLAAESARNLNALTRSEEYYTKLMELDEESKYDEASFYLAQVQHKLGKYDAARDNYQIFLSEYDGSSSDMREKAEKELAAVEWAKNFTEVEWQEYDIDHLTGINTPYTEFGATPSGDSLFYSSLRFDNKEDSYNPNRPVAGILVSENMADGTKLGDDFNMEGRHTAHTAFSKDGNRMYFTICSYKTSDSIICDLYYRQKNDGNWSSAVNARNLNMEGYTTTQPNVGYEGNKEYLYYASNRPGGEGGLDIWKVEIKEDGFGEPLNLKGINTSDNDLTPFYHSNTNTLYFGSDGHRSLGGIDIFKAYLKGGKAGEVQHMGYPLNSSYNDLYYYLTDDGKEAYFSSNRTGSLFLDEEVEACCYDIYHVNILPFANLNAQVFEITNKDSLFGATVELLDLSVPANSASQMDPKTAKYLFPLDRDRDYVLIASKEGYLPDTIKFNTRNLKSLDDIVKKLYLKTDELTLDAFTFDAMTKKALTGATLTVIDLDNPNADPIVISNFDANDFHITLDRGKKYRVIATRKGYRPATLIIDTDDYKNKSRIRKDIYLEVGDLRDFLPLVLFFDNDHPNPDTWLTKTDINYALTYPPYYARKQTFIDTYTLPLEGDEKAQAGNQLGRFFETEVKKGNNDIGNFLGVLEKLLQDGKEISIFLKGYTSPRASRAYNFALGQRRVSSVQNEFMKFSNGALEQYLESGKLKIKQKSFGETTAPNGISARMSDERNSIYSLEASKERRVEIIQVEFDK